MPRVRIDDVVLEHTSGRYDKPKNYAKHMSDLLFFPGYTLFIREASPRSHIPESLKSVVVPIYDGSVIDLAIYRRDEVRAALLTANFSQRARSTFSLYFQSKRLKTYPKQVILELGNRAVPFSFFHGREEGTAAGGSGWAVLPFVLSMERRTTPAWIDGPILSCRRGVVAKKCLL